MTRNIIIVGAGIVGLTLALALAQRKFKVTIIEKKCVREATTYPSDLRVSAINLASQGFFKKLDVWLSIQNSAAPFEQIRIFEPGQRYQLIFDSNLIQASQLGFIVENNVMLKALTEALLEHSVEILYETSVESIDLSCQSVKLRLSSGNSITSQLVVGADGSHSKLRELAGILINSRSYHQTALIAQIHIEKSHQKIASQCFLPNGPLAFLPLKDPHCCSIVWSTTSKEAEELLSLSNEAFESRLQIAFENNFGDLRLESERKIFPLKFRYANSFVKPGFALVGDAVHSIHPLAGQGLNISLQDVACFVKSLEAAREQGYSVGDYSVLRRYARSRKTQHVAMIAAIDLLKFGFSVRFSPFVYFREKFLDQCNHIDTLKRLFIGHATGVISS